MSRARNIADTGDNNLDDIVVDGSGNVGIGTSSPNARLEVEDAGGGSVILKVTADDSSPYGFVIGNDTFSTTDTDGLAMWMGNTGQAIIEARGSGAYHTFRINATEAARIDSSGNFLSGTTSTGTSTNGFVINHGAGYTYSDVNHTSGTSSGASFFRFRYSGNIIGSISQSGTTGVTYNTSSDYRLKENVVSDWDATTRLKQLNPVRFNFIADPDTTVDGFLAHEVQDVVPEAITGTKDAMRDEEYEVTPAVLDEDGNVVTPAVMGTRSVPDYQGIDQSKLVPLLVKTIQELEVRIAALENA